MKNIIILILLLVSLTSAYAQHECSDHTICELEAAPAKENPVKIRSKYHDKNGRRLLQKSAATIQITYEADFPTAARTAVDFAAEIWESILNTDQIIRIEATWNPSSPGNLASAGPRQVWIGGSLPSGIWYPDPLADALIDSDLNGGGFDIGMNFNSSRSDWYFGTDANPAINEYDLVTVAIHEILHGLGFVGTASTTGDADSTFIEQNGAPYIWDTFIENNGGTPILDFSGQQLLDNLTGNNLFFDGMNTRMGNENARAKIYAPSSWNGGSSYSHLDEATYPDELMTPFLSAGDALQNPSLLVESMLRDLGWDIGCTTVYDLQVSNFFGIILPGTYLSNATITTSSTTVDSESPVVFKAGTKIEITGTPSNPFTANTNFSAFVSPEFCDEDGLVSHEVENRSNEQILPKKESITISPNPFRNRAIIIYYLPEQSRVTLSLISIDGQKMQTLLPTQLREAGEHQLELDGSTLTPGIYFCQIRTATNVLTQKFVVTN